MALQVQSMRTPDMLAPAWIESKCHDVDDDGPTDTGLSSPTSSSDASVHSCKDAASLAAARKPTLCLPKGSLPKSTPPWRSSRCTQLEIIPGTHDHCLTADIVSHEETRVHRPPGLESPVKRRHSKPPGLESPVKKRNVKLSFFINADKAEPLGATSDACGAGTQATILGYGAHGSPKRHMRPRTTAAAMQQGSVLSDGAHGLPKSSPQIPSQEAPNKAERIDIMSRARTSALPVKIRNRTGYREVPASVLNPYQPTKKKSAFAAEFEAVTVEVMQLIDPNVPVKKKISSFLSEEFSIAALVTML